VYINGKYAIAHGISFVTDFIYDDYFDHWRSDIWYATDIIAVKLNDKWGIVDKNGNTAVPFYFDEILTIDNETAFAKINGKYGILDITATSPYATLPPTPPKNEPASEPEESRMTYMTTDNVNLREGPDMDFVRITTVPAGTTVKVIDILDGEWFLVNYEGQTGYMKAELLTEADEHYVEVLHGTHHNQYLVLIIFDAPANDPYNYLWAKGL